MTNHSRSEAGFSLIEVLVATAIMLVVTGGIFTVLNPSGAMFKAQPEVVDMQQRLRIGVDTLTRDLMMAGAGAYSGSQSGSLAGFFAPIQPTIQGNQAPPDLGAFPAAYRDNAITIFYVPSTSSQTSISQAMPNSSAELKVSAESGCPNGANLCGFTVGMSVLIYDDTGSFDTMTITQVQDAAAHLQHNQQGNLSKSYGIGAKVVQYQDHVYYYDPINRQLMHYDGYQTITPVLDEVVGLNFEYYGDPQPPAMNDGNGLKSQDVTYGPRPPVLGQVKGNWPAGENCTIQVTGGIQQPRLANLGAAGTGLVKLTAAQLSGADGGPMCPDAANSNAFAANLFRIRKVRVTIRLQTGDASLRGSLTDGQNALFVNTGRATGDRMVADQQIRFDVTPRNMSLNR
jgi:prepilin-type N-terminal cleavage/methylation domain-containing protein